MYAIITNLFFYLFALIFLLIMGIVPPQTEAHLTFFVLFLIFLGGGVIVTFSITMNHFVKNVSILEEIENLKTAKNIIILKEEKFEEIKAYYEEQVLKVFPEYEERVLEKLAPGNNKDLIALFQQYPELKSSKLLKEMIQEIADLMGSIYSSKSDLESIKWNLRVYLKNPWFLVKVKMSDDVLSEIKK